MSNPPSFNDEDEVKSCQFGKLEKCLCDDGNDCQDYRCELIGDECYVRKTCECGTLERCLCQDCKNVNGEEVGNEGYVKESCHSGVGICVCQDGQDPNCEQIGDVTVSYDDCNHDSVAGDNIALKTIDQELIGPNKTNAYVDTLFIDHTAQTTDGLKTFSKDISVEPLTSNGNDIAFGDKGSVTYYVVGL